MQNVHIFLATPYSLLGHPNLEWPTENMGWPHTKFRGFAPACYFGHPIIKSVPPPLACTIIAYIFFVLVVKEDIVFYNDKNDNLKYSFILVANQLLLCFLFLSLTCLKYFYDFCNNYV